MVERDFADSAAEGLSADWRMSIADNAGLQAATAALAAAGCGKPAGSSSGALGVDGQTKRAPLKVPLADFRCTFVAQRMAKCGRGDWIRTSDPLRPRRVYMIADARSPVVFLRCWSRLSAV